MLIKMSKLVELFGIQVNGILHIGAHECEELNDYIAAGVNKDNIHWIEGQESLVKSMKDRGIKNIYHGLIDDEDDKEVTFNISNNGQSSSILEFGSHLTHHPQVHYISKSICKTTRVDTLVDKHNISMSTINFINLDIQGVELRALKSMEKYLQYIDYIYTEVNTEEVYVDCAKMSEIDVYLNTFGFKRMGTHVIKQVGWGDAIYIKQK